MSTVSTWVTWPFRLLLFAGWFTAEVVRCSGAVLRDNLTPGQASTPGIARYDTRCVSDLEVTLFAALIVLTPGTLTMGTHRTGENGKRVLYVHSLYHADAGACCVDLEDMETRMLRAVRRRGVAT